MGPVVSRMHLRSTNVVRRCYLYRRGGQSTVKSVPGYWR